MTTVGLVGRLKASIIYCLFMNSVDPPCCRLAAHSYLGMQCRLIFKPAVFKSKSNQRTLRDESRNNHSKRTAHVSVRYVGMVRCHCRKNGKRRLQQPEVDHSEDDAVPTHRVFAALLNLCLSITNTMLPGMGGGWGGGGWREWRR